MSNDFSLDRRFAVPAVIGNPADFLIIGGLSGSAKDVGALTNESPNVYLLGGAMGAAVTMGLGLALAQPTRRVLVVSGDGEFLMNSGSLATVAYMKPANLSLLCVDNGCYGETGNQVSATSRSTNLELIARGSGIDHACTVQIESEFLRRQSCSDIQMGLPLFSSALMMDHHQTTVAILTQLKRKRLFAGIACKK